MAQVVLSAVGQSVGGPIGRAVGSTLGRAIDNRVVGSLGPARQMGPRLETLKVQGTAEGAPMACVFGRARVTGQVIWAARFLEGKSKGRAGKGGPKTVDYVYSLSFAVALCEGEIDGVGRVWADGRLMDMTGVVMRVHRGGEDQTADPPIEAVGPGVRHRWDEANALVVRVEGVAPESAVEMAVLGGGNALAVETAVGWEIVQYRSAVLVGSGTWRLTGLLRGQQGTEVEMRAGAGAGAVVVFLDRDLARAEIGRGERGLPLVCRAGPAGAAPGGAGFSETLFVARGVHDRPWSPSGLMVETSAEGLTIRWTPRVRLWGDGWDGEPAAVDPMRFRLRILHGNVAVRTMEVEGVSAFYSAANLASDFPDGVTQTVRIAVAQWGEGFGWGSEAEVEAEIRRV